ncbi:MAG: hydantoinase/oxoprolinase family protein, partial [Rhizobiaceae bacterium]|nr:hydantoinase/oxoprolinase family protein [Rhizobiaceae bacterium]
VARVLDGLSERCRAFAEGPGAGALETSVTVKVDARYATQVWEIEVPLRGTGISSPAELADFVADFHRAHEDLFGFSDPASPIDVIGWTAEVTCRLAEQSGLSLAAVDAGAARPSRKAYFAATGWTEVPVLSFAGMPADQPVSGPAIVESSFTTVVVDPGAVAVRRPSGSLSIEVGTSS